jgi:hypothetical protein
LRQKAKIVVGELLGISPGMAFHRLFFGSAGARGTSAWKPDQRLQLQREQALPILEAL